MEAVFYKQLQMEIATIRQLYTRQKLPEPADYARELAQLSRAREVIRERSPRQERRILLYCIDTLIVLLREGDRKKILDYTSAIKEIPEIYMGERNLYSIAYKLMQFQARYGKRYFPFVGRIRPYFSKKAPKNAAEYFSSASDEEFKRLHPLGYRVLITIALIVLFLPMLVYMLFVYLLYPAPNAWPLILGQVGAFAVGIGLFNIVAAWIHQYLGHLLTIGCFVVGAGMILPATLLLYA